MPSPAIALEKGLLGQNAQGNLYYKFS